MTEAEWLAGADPLPMLDALRTVSARKLRLFACACCRRVADVPAHPLGQGWVEVAERFADGLATNEERITAFLAGNSSINALLQRIDREADPRRFRDYQLKILALRSAYAGCYPEAPMAARKSAENALAAVCHSDDPRHPDRPAERRQQAALLRCVVGNPFRPVPADPAWRTANAVVLARTIYEEWRWELLPLLADLLEEVGCPAEVSDHCRGGGPHARGCWVVDLVLGLP